MSHVFISFTLELERRRKEEILQNQSQVPFGQIQLSLLVLSGAYVAFALPVLIIENMELEDSGELGALCAYSWYWWMYAINFLLYITTLSDFRRLYKQLFSDLNIIKLNEEDSDMNTIVNLSIRQNSNSISSGRTSQ